METNKSKNWQKEHAYETEMRSKKVKESSDIFLIRLRIESVLSRTSIKSNEAL